jgi:hypothetical protein
MMTTYKTQQGGDDKQCNNALIKQNTIHKRSKNKLTLTNIKHEGLRAAFDLQHLFRVPLIIIIF